MLRRFFSWLPRQRAPLAAAALLAGALAACGPLREIVAPTAPAVNGEWAVLLGEIRSYERGIGFVVTANFSNVSKDRQAFPFCGHTSRLALPWSYEDAAIHWRDVDSEVECRALAADDDVFFRNLEAKGESATPVTRAMLDGKLDRFIYLVIHEDCHDQFELPFGVEEALCDFVTHQAMIAFAGQKYGFFSREQRSIRRYADGQAAAADATVEWYERTAMLYARFQRGEITQAALQRERAALYAAAERPMALGKGELNNVSLATNMTYSRYYALIEEVFDAERRDLARTVAFFRKIDAAQAPPAQPAGNERNVEVLRASESAIVAAVRAQLVRNAASVRNAF